MNTIIYDQARLISQARELAAIGTVAALREHAGTDDTLCALVDFWGAARQALADLIAIAERAGGPDDTEDDSEDQGDEDDDRAGEYDEEEDWQPYCTVTGCGATVGIFVAHGDAWLHYTGQGTPQDPIELFDAGHEPVVAWRPAGAQ